MASFVDLLGGAMEFVQEAEVAHFYVVFFDDAVDDVSVGSLLEGGPYF